MTTEPLPFPSSIMLRASLDHVDGVPVDSDYVEVFWLPMLGPTAYLVWRRLARTALGVVAADVPIDQLAQSLGVRPWVARRALLRLVHFGLATLSDGEMAVAVVAPRTIASKLPKHLQALHEEATA